MSQVLELFWLFVLGHGVKIINAIIDLFPAKTAIVDDLRLALAASVGWAWLRFVLRLINYLVPLGPILSFFFWRPLASSSTLAFRAAGWVWRSVKW